MNALNIDTLKFARSLKAAGADERLAEAIAEGVAGVDASELATRTDVAELRAEMADLRAEMRTEIAQVRTEMAALRTELRTDIAALRSEMVRMHLISTLGIIAAVFTMLRFFAP